MSPERLTDVTLINVAILRILQSFEVHVGITQNLMYSILLVANRRLIRSISNIHSNLTLIVCAG